MKVNFKEIEIKTKVEGGILIVDFRKSIGNILWGGARDIASSDFGKTIYYSEGAIDVPDDIATQILSLIKETDATVIVQKGLIESLTPKI